MAVVGELEGLIQSHTELMSRGQIVDAAKVKEMVSEYMDKKEMSRRLYKGVTHQFDEFLYCAETNFERFRDILNFEHLTEMEYFYPEYFGELTGRINKSCMEHLKIMKPMFAGLLFASSMTADGRILQQVVDYLLKQRNFDDLQRLFERLNDTRRKINAYLVEKGKPNNYPLIRDEGLANRLGRLIYANYEEESQHGIGAKGYVAAKNAYQLIGLVGNYFPELELVADGNLIDVATDFMKEIALRVEGGNVNELVDFIEHFKKSPVAERFSKVHPELFTNYMNRQDVKQALESVIRNLLRKAEFGHAKRLSQVLDGMVSFRNTFKEHLDVLKRDGFLIQAIELADKLELKEAVTDELKMEVFDKLMDELERNTLPQTVQKVKKFSAKYKITAKIYPKIAEKTTGQLMDVEKKNPELRHILTGLYDILDIERPVVAETGGFGGLFEPIIGIFSFIFKIFVKMVVSIAGMGQKPKAAAKR